MARKLKKSFKGKPRRPRGIPPPPKTKRYRHPRDEVGGKPVIDAKDPLTLTVERVDIRGAASLDPSNCGAARAIIRQEHVKSARVYRSVIFVEFKDHVERYRCPARLRQETISFDRGASGKFMEGDYILPPMPPSQLLGAQHLRPSRKGGDDKRRPPPIQPEGTRTRAPLHHYRDK